MMLNDSAKSREELLIEIDQLRRRNMELEAFRTRCERLEESISRTEERYNKLLKNSPYGIGISKGNRVIFANPALLDIFGYETLEEFVRVPILDHVAEEYRDMIAERLRKWDRGEKLGPRFEYRIIRKDGGTRDIELSTSEAHIGGERYVQSIFRDITDQKVSDEKLAEKERRFRLITENTADVIWTSDMNLRFTFVTPSVEKLTGFTVEESMARTIDEVLTPESLEKAMSVFQEELELEEGGQADPGRSRTIELEVYRKDGSTVWVEYRVSILRDLEGNMVELLGVARDISERKRAEKLLVNERDLAVALSDVRDFDTALRLCLDTAIKVSGTDSGGVYLVDDQTDAIDLACHQDLSPEFVESVSGYGEGTTQLKLVLEGKPIYLQYQDLKVPFQKAELEEGLLAMAVIPIMHIGKVIACINVASHTNTEMSTQGRNALETVAAQIGGAIGRLRAENDLRESEEQYRNLVENNPYGIQEIDTSGNITYGNPAYHKMLGYNPGELVGKSILELLVPEGRREELQEYLQVLAEQQPPQTTYYQQNRKMDGAVIDMAVDWDYKRDMDGRVVGFTSVITDITERLRTEKLLREREERFRSIAENIEDVFWMSTPGITKMLYVSPAYEQIWGKSRESLYLNPRSFLESVHPDDRKKVRDGLKDHEEGRWGFEYRIIQPDGTVRWIKDRGFPVYDEEGNLLYLTGVASDITDMKLYQEALWKAAREWRTTFDIMSDMIMIVNSNFMVTRTNEALSKFLGIPFDKILNRPCYELIHETGSPPDFCPHRKVLETGETKTARIHDDTRNLDFVITATPIFDKDGNLTGSVHVMHNITGELGMEKKLREAEKMATVGEIAGGIAHEIKNPLFAISSAIEILQKKLPLERKIQKTFDTLLSETMRVDRLVRQLLNFSRYQRRQETKRDPISVRALVNEVVALNRTILQEKNVKLKKRIPPDLPGVRADRDKILQVLVNLIQNAADVTGKDGTIEIACGVDAKKKMMSIQVKDRGPGVADELRERIFDLFFTTKKGNSGMGLAVSRRIMQDHDGDIRVEKRKGGGSVFIVEWPMKT